MNLSVKCPTGGLDGDANLSELVHGGETWDA